MGENAEAADEPVELVAYDAEWVAKFNQESAMIERAFGGLDVEVHHIGSTAVPGLAAKPIVDILVAANSISDRDAMKRRLSALEYINVSHSDDDKRLFFKKGIPRAYHVHIVKRNSWTYWKHLLFRDSLIADRDLRVEYEQLKMALAAKFRDDRAAYSDAKTEFIERVVAERVRRG